MGAVAASVLAKGGQATGIIPEFLAGRERPMVDVQELIVTRDMHERKRIMFERSDAFVALPGGIGTLEELVEQLTWAQLGRHKKPILIANINGFWDPLRALLDHMKELAFIHTANNVNLLVQMVLLNYMALHGEQGQFANVFLNHGLGDPTLLDRYIAFAPIV